MATRVVIVGQIFSPNLGDRVIYDCLAHLFAHSGITTLPIDLSGRRGWPKPEISGSETSSASLAIQLPRLPALRGRLKDVIATLERGVRLRENSARWREEIASADAVVIGGGQLLTDINLGFPPRIYEVVRLAKECRKPLAFFACGAGATWSASAARLYGSALSYAKYISVRDHDSAFSIRRSICPRTAVHVHPDPGFFAADVYGPINPPSELAPMGFSVQPAKHFRRFVPSLRDMSDTDYSDFWVRLAAGATRAERRITFLTNGEPGDQTVAAAIAERLRSRGMDVGLAARPERPEQLVAALADTSSLVCTRLHAGITAYSLGRSFAPISWDPKVDGVWSLVGRGSSVLSAALLMHDDPWQKVERIIAANRPRPNQLHDIQRQVLAASVQCAKALGLQ